MRLKDKVVIITGAGGAIGAATARRFAAEGAKLVLVDASPNIADMEVDGLQDQNKLIISVDLSTNEGNEAMVRQTIERFKKIDVFFANAGIEGVSSSLTDYPDEAYQRVMDINVKGVYLGLKHVVPSIQDGASIILNSSIAGISGVRRNAPYAASKHAVVGIMRCAAIELAPRGIRVNTVHPGYVDSPMLRRLIDQHPDPAAAEAKFVALTKLGKLVQPDDIANGVLFLAGDESKAITSQTLVIDAGAVG